MIFAFLDSNVQKELTPVRELEMPMLMYRELVFKMFTVVSKIQLLS